MDREILKFWIVWSPQGRTPPSHRHWSKDDAMREAERLAKASPNAEFFAMKCVGGFSSEPTVSQFKIVPGDGIPF